MKKQGKKILGITPKWRKKINSFFTPMDNKNINLVRPLSLGVFFCFASTCGWGEPQCNIIIVDLPQIISINPGTVDMSTVLSAITAMDVGSVGGANAALASADSALGIINAQRARYGSLQNRFESSIASLQTSSENMEASRSRIRDADFATETAQLTRAQILQQAGVAMLAQANSLPNQVLTLLKG